RVQGLHSVDLLSFVSMFSAGDRASDAWVVCPGCYPYDALQRRLARLHAYPSLGAGVDRETWCGSRHLHPCPAMLRDTYAGLDVRLRVRYCSSFLWYGCSLYLGEEDEKNRPSRPCDRKKVPTVREGCIDQRSPSP